MEYRRASIRASTTINEKGLEAGLSVWKLITNLEDGSSKLEKYITQDLFVDELR